VSEVDSTQSEIALYQVEGKVCRGQRNYFSQHEAPCVVGQNVNPAVLLKQWVGLECSNESEHRGWIGDIQSQQRKGGRIRNTRRITRRADHVDSQGTQRFTHGAAIAPRCPGYYRQLTRQINLRVKSRQWIISGSDLQIVAFSIGFGVNSQPAQQR